MRERVDILVEAVAMTQAPLEGRHAVVTGGGTGIGAAIASRLTELGAVVTLMGRRREALENRAAALPGARAIVCDVTDEEAVARAFAEAAESSGAVGILVNNAGAARSSPFLETVADDFRAMLEVNCLGAAACMRAVLPDMLRAGHGRIVNIASTAAIKGYAYVSAYCAAKHAMVGLTRAVALETARKGVTVNAVCPGYTNTDLVEESVARIVEKTGRSAEDARRALERSNPQGRLIEPEEVAAAVAWLCLPGSDAITGQAIAVAGGEVM